MINIFVLILILLFPSLALSQTPFNFSVSRGLAVFGGPNPNDSLPSTTSYTITPTQAFPAKLSVSTGVAFIDTGSTSISTNASGFTAITVTDTTGKTLTGFLKAPGTTETYGAERVLNPAFTTDTANWVPFHSAVLASVAGGQSGNALRVTENGAGQPEALQNLVATKVEGALTLASAYVKQGTQTNYSFYMNIAGASSGNGNFGMPNSTLATGAFVQQLFYVTLPPGETTENFVLLSQAANGSAQTFFFDTVSDKIVTAPSSTGATVVTTAGGAVQNWASETAGFNRNDTAYRINLVRTR